MPLVLNPSQAICPGASCLWFIQAKDVYASHGPQVGGVEGAGLKDRCCLSTTIALVQVTTILPWTAAVISFRIPLA